MLVIGISSSPRKGSNSKILLKEVLRGAKFKGAKTQVIDISNMKINSCIACGICYEKTVCIIKDDMQKIYTKIKKADILVLASPIYFGSLCAQAKAMIDRCQLIWEQYKRQKKKVLKGKKRLAVLILTSSSYRKKFFRNAEEIAKNFFAVLGAKYYDRLFCPGLEGEREIMARKDCLRKAYGLGLKLSYKR